MKSSAFFALITLFLAAVPSIAQDIAQDDSILAGDGEGGWDEKDEICAFPTPVRIEFTNV